MNRLTKIICGFVVAIVASLSAQCGTLCSGESAATIIDLTVGTRTAVLPEHIRYSTEWVDGATEDSVAVVEVNGEAISSVSGTGFVDWTPRTNAVYVLTHKVLNGEEQVGETLTATFLVEGLAPEAPVITPESGTTFSNSLTVSMTCPTEGATIHYTTDGSEPTAESPTYKKFRVYGKTTVKAIVIKDGLLSSETATAEYALGRCENPVISLEDGSEFSHSNHAVSIDWGEDGVLRYTLDGSDPTKESPVYEGPFYFSESVVLKAKVFSDDFFDSEVATSSLTRVWESVATPQIDVAETFMGSKTMVAITCGTEGALVRYTLNGNDPNSHSTKYTGPFYVTDSCTIKAYAVMNDYLNSAVAERSVEKIWTIGDSMGDPDHSFSTEGSRNLGWTSIVDATAPNGVAMKSGEITHYEATVLATTVEGAGRLTFSWRTSCEEDPDGLYEWDHVEFAVDGVVVRQLDGEKAWQTETVDIVGEGEHNLEWRYRKDDVEGEGDDAAWVAGYEWTGVPSETKTTPVPVPYVWLEPYVAEFGSGDYEAAANALSGKVQGGKSTKVWEEFVAGTDPTNETSVLTAKIDIQDGVPVVTWEPNLNTNSIERLYKVYGKETLSSTEEWTYPTNSLHRFFKVTVEMP